MRHDRMDPQVYVPIIVAVIGVSGVIVGVIVNNRREQANTAQRAVERTENEMEKVLRERLRLRDERIRFRDEQIAQLERQIELLVQQRGGRDPS